MDLKFGLWHATVDRVSICGFAGLENFDVGSCVLEVGLWTSSCQTRDLRFQTWDCGVGGLDAILFF